MNAGPLLAEIGRTLAAVRLEAVLIGNAAAALQGAPVTTVDFDFMFRDTPGNRRKLKALAARLGAIVMRPFYPASKLYRLIRDDDGLQVDFMVTIHGVRSFEGLRDRATPIEIDGVTLMVATLADIIKASARLVARATAPSWRYCSVPTKKRPGRKAQLAAVARENERAEREMIRRWQALPPGKRTNFLRKRVGPRATAL
jgi:hypothetical protein